MKPFLSVVIPVYNEAERLPPTLIDIDSKLSRAEYSSEILVVNDGSHDNTANIVKNFQSIIKNLRFIDNKENRGKGYVVREGMLAAKGNYRLFMDSDNSTTVEQVEKMISFLKDGYDIVIGSRAIKGAKLTPPQHFLKKCLGKMSNPFIQLLAVPGIKDTQCGFKCFSEESAEKIFSRGRINRWGIDIEALMLAQKLGYRIKEIPVSWANDFDSRVLFGDYFFTFYEVLKIRWWIMKKEYNLPE